MIRITAGAGDLSDTYLKRITQLGVDCVDFGDASILPGVEEQGYPDLDELLKIKRNVRSWGLDVNRVTLPDMTESFFKDEPGSDKEIENAVQTMRVFGDAGMTLASQRFEGSNFNHLITYYRPEHRGGYPGSGKSLWLTGRGRHSQLRRSASSAGPAPAAAWPTGRASASTSLRPAMSSTIGGPTSVESSTASSPSPKSTT